MWTVEAACQLICDTRELPYDGLAVRVVEPFDSTQRGWRRNHGKFHVANRVVCKFHKILGLAVSANLVGYTPQRETTTYHFQVDVKDVEWSRWLRTTHVPRSITWLRRLCQFIQEMMKS